MTGLVKDHIFLLKRYFFLELNKIWFSLILYSKQENCASPFAERDNFVSQCTAFCGTRVLYSHCVTRRIWSTFFSRSLRNGGRKEWRRSAENPRFNVGSSPDAEERKGSQYTRGKWKHNACKLIPTGLT